MEKKLYKSAIDQVSFDNQLDEKILNYLSENSGGNNMDNKKWKFKFSTSVAIATCTVFMVSATGYAAIRYFNNIAHMDYGLTSQDISDGEGISSSEDDNEVFMDTSEIRDKMSTDVSDMLLLVEEKGSNKVNWNEKRVWKDTAPVYISNDGVDWKLDEEGPTGIVTEYTYSSYEMAIQDAEFPNVMKELLSKFKMNYGVLEEYSTEVSSDVYRKSVSGEFTYQGGKILVELSHDESGENGVSVYTGVERTINQRTYDAKNGVTYQLSDSEHDGIIKTTTLISSGSYSLLLQFEELADNEIYTILNDIDITGLNLQ